MTRHLSISRIKALCVSALPVDDLASAAVHTAECQLCQQRFVEELKRQRGSTSFNFTLEPGFWFRHDHVDFDLLVVLADKTLDHETEGIINLHLKTCETCREDVRSFLAFRNATAGELEVSYDPTNYGSSHNVVAHPWWRRLQTRPVYAVAAMVLLAIAVLVGMIALNRRTDPLQANKQGTNPDEGSPSISASPAPDVISTPPIGADSKNLVIIKDRSGEVTIDKDGRVTGLDEISETNRKLIAQAALSEQIGPIEVLRRLSGEQSGLRGDDNGPGRFRLLYPVRRVVTEDRPVFRWERLSGASSYRVYVLDADGNQVSESDELPPTKTQWKAPVPLRRDRIFSWVVTADLDGKKVVSPSASMPEMKFAVLSTENFQALTRLKKSNSHLALGVFYARAGLLDEAAREFEELARLNPDSELPRNLLQSVRNKRNGK